MKYWHEQWWETYYKFGKGYYYQLYNELKHKQKYEKLITIAEIVKEVKK